MNRVAMSSVKRHMRGIKPIFVPECTEAAASIPIYSHRELPVIPNGRAFVYSVSSHPLSQLDTDG